MATLATPLFAPLVNPILGLLPPPAKQIDRPARARPASKLLQYGPEEPCLDAMLPSLTLVPLALLAVFLWPVLFVGLVLLLVVLTPVVVGVRVLATLTSCFLGSVVTPLIRFGGGVRVLATLRHGRPAAG